MEDRGGMTDAEGGSGNGHPVPWWRRLILRGAPDVLALLTDQGRVSLEAIETFARWSEGGGGAETKQVRDLEHQADDARRALVVALRETLSTPIDQENLYVLSERCDRVVNAAKNLVRLAEALGWKPDNFAAEMAEDIRRAMERIVEGFGRLGTDPEGCGAAADAAIKATRGVPYVYRHAVAKLFEETDLRGVMVGRELYGAYAALGDLTAAVADRLWYAVLSEN
jgi:uncharacterized protein Yka (UPF0111/DUF47 family)